MPTLAAYLNTQNQFYKWSSKHSVQLKRHKVMKWTHAPEGLDRINWIKQTKQLIGTKQFYYSQFPTYGHSENRKSTRSQDNRAYAQQKSLSTHQQTQRKPPDSAEPILETPHYGQFLVQIPLRVKITTKSEAIASDNTCLDHGILLPRERLDRES